MNFIAKSDFKKYIGKTVWAMFQETKTKCHARLVSYHSGIYRYKMYCGVHKNYFECNEIAEIEELNYGNKK